MKIENLPNIDYGYICYSISISNILKIAGYSIPEDVIYMVGDGVNCYYGFEKGSMEYVPAFIEGTHVALKPLCDSIDYFVRNVASCFNVQISLEKCTSTSELINSIHDAIDIEHLTVVRVDSSYLYYLDYYYGKPIHIPHYIGLIKSDNGNKVILIDSSPLWIPKKSEIYVDEIEFECLEKALISNDIYRGKREFYSIERGKIDSWVVNEKLLHNTLKSTIEKIEGKKELSGLNCGIDSIKMFSNDIANYDKYWSDSKQYSEVMNKIYIDIFRYPFATNKILGKFLKRVEWVDQIEVTAAESLANQIAAKWSNAGLAFIKAGVKQDKVKSQEKLSNMIMEIYEMENALVEKIKEWI